MSICPTILNYIYRFALSSEPIKGFFSCAYFVPEEHCEYNGGLREDEKAFNEICLLSDPNIYICRDCQSRYQCMFGRWKSSWCCLESRLPQPNLNYYVYNGEDCWSAIIYIPAMPVPMVITVRLTNLTVLSCRDHGVYNMSCNVRSSAHAKTEYVDLVSLSTNAVSRPDTRTRSDRVCLLQPDYWNLKLYVNSIQWAWMLAHLWH